MIIRDHLKTVAILLAASAFLGCRSEVANEAEPVEMSGPPPMFVQSDDHSHGSEGPHGGHLIELGRNHEYHAELVHGDASQQVIVYVLDHDMNPVAIQQPTIHVNLVIEGKTAVFQLAGTQQDDGTYATFLSSDALLASALDSQAELEGKLRLTIAGVPYVGRIAHAGDHAGHHH